MIKVIFKNLEPSELAKVVAVERLASVAEKFPDLGGSLIDVRLERHNSPQQAGPDSYSVTVYVVSGRYKGLRLTKEARHLYAAIAELSDRFLDRLNRYGDRQRVRQRRLARKQREVLSATGE